MTFTLKKYYLFLFVIVVFLALTGTSCSFKKSLPEGAYRYTGAKVKVEVADSIKLGDLEYDLTTALRPKPNRKLFGIPWRLIAYNAFYSKKKDKVVFLKKMAEAPVLYDKAVKEEMEKVLKSVAFNNGFFNAETESEVDKHERLRTADVTYTVNIDAPYRVEKITYDVKTPRAGKLLNGQREKSVVKIGTPYQLEALRVERKRLANYMKTQGYFYFSDDMLKFTADTSYADRSIHLLLDIKPETPPTALKPYYVGHFRILPDYEISDSRNEILQKDSLTEGNFTFIYKDLIVKPEVLKKAVTLKPGELYDPELHQSTLRRLSNLNTFKYFSVRFETLPNNDSLLDARILLTPKPKRTIEAEPGASFQAGLYFTPQATINYTNRNLFRGSELLRISGTGAFNLPLNDSLASNNRYQLLATVQKPGLWSPFDLLYFSDRTIGSTQGKINLQQQSYGLRFAGDVDILQEEFPDLADFLRTNPDYNLDFSILTAELSFGYIWRKKQHIRHELNPLSFGIQRSSYEESQTEPSDDFVVATALLASTPQIALSTDNMIFYKPEYIFSIDTRQKRFKQDNFLLRTRFAFAGNRLTGGGSEIFTEQQLQSNYFIFEPDFRYLGVFSKKSQLAARFAPFVTFPFNENSIVPFFDLYSVGGPASNRAFIPRNVGPGSTPPSRTFQFPFVGVGNAKLEANVEYRYQVTSLIEVAAFVDAGNVWQVYDIEDRFQEQFKIDRFYRQLAVGTGIGFRLDFEILLLRFDFGVPLVKPFLPEGERFVGDEIQLGDREYRQENLQFNFAFGYPF